MARGRKPSGPEAVDRLDGSPEAKERLKTILATIAGTLTVGAACERLGVGQTRFEELRREVWEAALVALEPKPAGRPTRMPREEETRIATLETQNKELQVALVTSQLREELAIAMPHLLKPGGGEKKRNRELTGRRARIARRSPRDSTCEAPRARLAGESGARDQSTEKGN